jgi:hypothetical protein
MSASIFREKGYRFYFISNEEERIHIHVTCEDGEAKFWLEPIISWTEPKAADRSAKNC